MSRRAYYTIKAIDVGRDSLRMFGRTWPCSGFIGQILPGDVGKRCYDFGHYVAVENDVQAEARAAKIRALPSQPRKDGTA